MASERADKLKEETRQSQRSRWGSFAEYHWTNHIIMFQV